jgi:argininosuccinate lyase
LLLVHLSRWAEEVVLWTTREFGFARLSDGVAKGSSLMPQKKNPEAAEVLRGKSGRVVGDLVAHLVQLKGLPLTYNSDLQEDKEALFDALDAAAGGVGAAEALLRGLRFDTERMRAGLRGGFLTATDLADGLVLRGVAFRDAHESAGRAVRRAEDLGVELWELPLEELQACCPRADGDLLRELDPEASVRAHASPGGPAPQRVAEQLAAARVVLSERAAWRDAQAPPPIYRAHLEGALLHPR